MINSNYKNGNNSDTTALQRGCIASDFIEPEFQLHRRKLFHPYKSYLLMVCYMTYVTTFIMLHMLMEILAHGVRHCSNTLGILQIVLFRRLLKKVKSLIGKVRL